MLKILENNVFHHPFTQQRAHDDRKGFWMTRFQDGGKLF
jgi:hypothetical protein